MCSPSHSSSITMVVTSTKFVRQYSVSPMGDRPWHPSKFRSRVLSVEDRSLPYHRKFTSFPVSALGRQGTHMPVSNVLELQELPSPRGKMDALHVEICALDRQSLCVPDTRVCDQPSSVADTEGSLAYRTAQANLGD